MIGNIFESVIRVGPLRKMTELEFEGSEELAM